MDIVMYARESRVAVSCSGVTFELERQVHERRAFRQSMDISVRQACSSVTIESRGSIRTPA
jgi:hypothetical protein